MWIFIVIRFVGVENWVIILIEMNLKFLIIVKWSSWLFFFKIFVILIENNFFKFKFGYLINIFYGYSVYW